MIFARRLLLVSSVLLLVSAVIPSHAQPVWKQAFGYQMSDLLQSPDPMIQETALQLVIEVADWQDNDIVLGPAAESLMNVYKTTTIRAHRQMALAALTKIDSPEAYAALLEGALTEQDTGLQIMLLQAVASSHSITEPSVAVAFNELLKLTRG